MVCGTLLGIFVPGLQEALNSNQIDSVSLPVFIGLLLMLYPVFCKVKYEELIQINKTKKYLQYLVVSMVLNWLVCPLVMAGLAWITLLDLPDYRIGVLLIGIARCIAMVLVWNDLANGSPEWCVILVAVNSILQMILFTPFLYVFVVVMGGTKVPLNVWFVSKNVLIFLGIPFFAGYLTRTILKRFTRNDWYERMFIPVISPVALGGLLYTIIIMFALQGKQILDQIGPVCRVVVPLFLYFTIVWILTMYLCFRLNFPFQIAITQSFTAASNNFELAMAIAIATFGIDSKQALATTVGPLVEVPVLLGLVSVVPKIEPFYKDSSIY
jgi:ACR3 family arsenite transporter